MNCRRCQGFLSEFIDGDLTPRRERAVIEHLATCGECSAVRAELLAMTGLFGDLPSSDFLMDPPGLDAPGDMLWNRLDAALDADEAKRARRLAPWSVLVPAVGGAALIAAAGLTEGVRVVSARRTAQAVDSEMRAQSEQAIGETWARTVTMVDARDGASATWQLSDGRGLAPDVAAVPLFDAAHMTEQNGAELTREMDALDERVVQQAHAKEEAWLKEAEQLPAPKLELALDDESGERGGGEQ